MKIPKTVFTQKVEQLGANFILPSDNSYMFVLANIALPFFDIFVEGLNGEQLLGKVSQLMVHEEVLEKYHVVAAGEISIDSNVVENEITLANLSIHG